MSKRGGEHVDFGEHPSKRLARISKKFKPALYQATVTEISDAAGTRGQGPLDNVAQDIINRIKKCLETAYHPNTVESVMRTALAKAQRLMQQFNVTQAEVLAHEAEKPLEERKKVIGESRVSLTRTNGDRTKQVNLQVFVEPLMSAMDIFFDCESWSDPYFSRQEITFCGPANNSEAAALAFEMVYNLICEWAKQFKGTNAHNCYCIGVADELQEDAERQRTEELARAEQAANDAKDALAAEEKEAELVRARALARLNDPSDERAASVTEEANSISSSLHEDQEPTGALGPYRGLDDDVLEIITSTHPQLLQNFRIRESMPEDDNDYYSDDDSEDEEDEDFFTAPKTIRPNDPMEVEVQVKVALRHLQFRPSKATTTPGVASKTTRANTKTTQANTEHTKLAPEESQVKASTALAETTWKNSQQVMVWRETVQKLIGDYMKEKGIKLVKGRKRVPATKWDDAAYKVGKKDSKWIDVHRKQLASDAFGEE